MNNYIKPGDTMTFTAPVGGVVSGTAYMIGSLLVVATNTVDAGLEFEGLTEGVVTLPKATGSAWTEGAMLYWSTATNNLVVATAAAARRVGVAAVAAASGDTSGVVRLTGSPSVVNVA